MTTMFATDEDRDAFTRACILGDTRQMSTTKLLKELPRYERDGIGPEHIVVASIYTVLWCRLLTPVGR